MRESGDKGESGFQGKVECSCRGSLNLKGIVWSPDGDSACYAGYKPGPNLDV